MPMNLVIREKRKELGMTQEQVADYLGVTTPAVNRWEKGLTYPEVTLLPGLARLLKIDLNALFSFFAEPSEQEISQYLNQVVEVMKDHGFEKGYALARERIQEFPNCQRLTYYMAMTVEGSLLMTGVKRPEREHYEKELLHLYQRILESEDAELAEGAAVMLFGKYLNQKEYEKAEEMLEKIPEKKVADKNQLKAQLYLRQGKSAEAAALLERKLYQTATDTFGILVSLAEIAREDGREEDAVQLGRITEQYTELFQLSQYMAIPIRLENAAKKKQIGECLRLLEELLKASKEEWEPGKSILYRNLFQQGKKQKVSMSYLLKPLLTAVKEEEQFDFLREEKAFQELLETWEKLCEQQ